MAEGLPLDQEAHRGRPVKASYDVKEGDVLELRFGERTVKVEVLSVAEHVGKADAPALYRELR